jgi:hypothetical protein
MSTYFTNDDPLGEGLLKSFGRHFDGKNDEPSYDCTEVNSCAIQLGNGVLYYRFDFGDVIISPSNNYRIEVVTLVQAPAPRTTPLSLGVNFPDDLGAITTASDKDAVEAILGDDRGVFVEGSVTYTRYDNDNIYVSYDSASTPNVKTIQINPKYQGAVDFPAPFGFINMRDSFADEFPGEDPDGEAFIKELVEYFSGEADGYDCLAEETCAIQVDSNFVYFVFEQGRFIFDVLEKKLIYIIFDEDQEIPTDEE